MQQFTRINDITGWVMFGLATLVYLLTLEPTASFWDCGEFIASAYRLQVPHPPGAPFFLLTGRLFSLLASDPLTVAYWVNVSSALYSGLTILFLFWTITLIGLKVLKVTHPQQDSPDFGQIIALMGAGVVGSLAYTFSDSFWFSAVEAEVYAMSSFFTAFVIWAVLKWDRIDDEALANRWLILTAYMMGLSIGVHILNLVTLPALALVYYYKKYPKPNLVGVGIALFVGLVIIGIVLEGVIVGLPTMAGNFEIFFVNTLGTGFGVGISLFILIVLGALVFGLWLSQQRQQPILNTSLLCLAFILIGYLSYGVIAVRALHNPPINENDPSDIMRLVYYLKREQYGDRPLMYGPVYTSRLVDQKRGAAKYRKNNESGKYEIYDYRTVNEFDHKMLFPRVYSRSENHKQLYANFINVPQGEHPSMGQNLYFFFTHQLGHMYWRYFGWNFVGRESDYEGAGVLSPFASNKDVPELIATNKARNQFYALPLILGILGLVYLSMHSPRLTFMTGMLFVLTGVALIIYLNSPPVEPRERDYIYVGSFYAFAIWIGLGVMFLYDLLLKAIKLPLPAAAIAIVLSLIPPVLMGQQGWDDHNRQNRYYSVDSARNLLASCAPNAILFTGGDNDTFPLWYVQDVEGFRTDVRVCNLSLLGTDWYIKQMKRPVYESEALPISLEYENFIEGTNDQVPYLEEHPNIDPARLQALRQNGMNLETYIQLIRENNNLVRVNFRTVTLNTLPTKRMVLELDSAAIVAQGFVPENLKPGLQRYMVWDLEANDLFKSDLMVLDLIATNNREGWKRPIYFSTTLGRSSYLNLHEYLQQEGLAYRLMPVRIQGARNGYVNSELMYENMMKNFHYRELNNPNVYYSDTYRSFPLGLRNAFYQLSSQLIREGKPDKAKEVINKAFEVLPDEAHPYDFYTPPLVSVLLKVGETEKAIKAADTMVRRANEMITYLASRNRFDEYEVRINFSIIGQLADIMRREGQEEVAKRYESILNTQSTRLSN